MYNDHNLLTDGTRYYVMCEYNTYIAQLLYENYVFSQCDIFIVYGKLIVDKQTFYLLHFTDAKLFYLSFFFFYLYFLTNITRYNRYIVMIIRAVAHIK